MYSLNPAIGSDTLSGPVYKWYNKARRSFMRKTLIAIAVVFMLLAVPVWADCTSFAWENQDGPSAFP